MRRWGITALWNNEKSTIIVYHFIYGNEWKCKRKNQNRQNERWI